MIKFTFLLLTILVGIQGFSQNLLERVPKTAECVVSIDGKKLTEKIGESKIKKSEAFIQLTSELIFRGKNVSRIDDIGIAIESGLVFFFTADTAVEYMAYLYGIEEPNLFEKYIRENDYSGVIEKHDQFTVYYYEGNYELIAWNGSYALYIIVDYLHDELKPIEEYDSFSWMDRPIDWEVEVAVEQTEEDACESAACESACDGVAIETMTCDNGDSGSGDKGGAVELSSQDAALIDSLKMARALALQKSKDERIVKLHNFYSNLLKPYFKENAGESILTNKNYISGKNPNADMHLFLTKGNDVHDYFADYPYYFSGRRYYRRYMSVLANYFGENTSVNAIFEKDNISVLSEIQYAPLISTYFSEIYSTKLSQKLMQYVKSDNVLAISSISMAAENMWKNYPKIYAKFYEKLVNQQGNYSEEIAVILDFIEIFMDEKALADIATGDIIFILNDISEVTGTYETYEYNEDYTIRQPVERTYTQIYPQFSAMFTTNNKAFLEKLLNLAVKQEMMQKGTNYYYTSEKNRDLPLQLGFTIQNGIAIISTDLEEIIAFAEGKTYKTASSDLYSKMAENQSYMAVNIQEILNSIPTNDMSKKKLELLECSRKNTRKMESFSEFKDGKLRMNMTIEIPSKSKNAADYAWDFMNEMYAIETKY